jgi:predicted TIM-barrel fold metal-dependent hydrolase
MQRRDFLKSAAASTILTAAGPMLLAADERMPVVDAHIHLFDPSRPGGVPWPEKTDSVRYEPALPARYAQLAEPHGVVGAIAIECSPWLVDNFWLQDVVERNPLMLGYIGDLLPDASDYGVTLDRLLRSPLFLGIRYGNLWNRDLGAAIQKPDFVAGLKLLAQAGKVLETANPDAALIAAVVQVTDKVPKLRVVLDHLPNSVIPTDASARSAYEDNLRELSHRSEVFVKGSAIVQRIEGRVVLDAGAYKASLDQMWETFGEDRIFFGSDWPNSDALANYDQVFSLAESYINTRSVAAQQKYFAKNSTAVYRWKARTPNQARIESAG